MNQSVAESVESNGNSVPADYPEVMNHRSSDSIENVSVNGVLVLPDDDDHEESIGSPQERNSVDGLRVESPGGSVHLTRRGFGLKKWRRIKRDGPVKDEATPVDDGSKLLKRGLAGLVNPPTKHVDLSSFEARQSSEGSVGSVNMLHHHQHQPSLANGFSTNPDFRFNVGQAAEKIEEHSGNFTGAKNLGGKIVSGRQEKIWSDAIKKSNEELLIAQKEKPCSSMDSDLRSSDFVFSSGAVPVTNCGEKDERLINHIGEYSIGGQVKEKVQPFGRSENGEKDEDGNESKESNRYWEDKDQFAESIRNLAALQEALWKEVQSFQELGNESAIPVHSNINDLSSSEQSRIENCREESSTSSGSQALILKQKEKHLKLKLEEARTNLKAKEARIQELEISKSESELEDIFQRKIETEIVHLMLTRSLNSSLQVLKQPNKVHPLTEDAEPNRGNILGKTCKFSLYFFTQTILLVSILRFLVLQFSPASRLVVPT